MNLYIAGGHTNREVCASSNVAICRFIHLFLSRNFLKGKVELHVSINILFSFFVRWICFFVFFVLGISRPKETKNLRINWNGTKNIECRCELLTRK